MDQATWEWSDGEGRRDVRVHGDFDVRGAEPWVEWMDEVLRTSPHPVVVDLSGVTFMDSTGVRSLLRLRQQHAEGWTIGPISEPVRYLFDVAGVADVLASSDTPTDGPEPS